MPFSYKWRISLISLARAWRHFCIIVIFVCLHRPGTSYIFALLKSYLKFWTYLCLRQSLVFILSLCFLPSLLLPSWQLLGSLHGHFCLFCQLLFLLFLFKSFLVRTSPFCLICPSRTHNHCTSVASCQWTCCSRLICCSASWIAYGGIGRQTCSCWLSSAPISKNIL